MWAQVLAPLARRLEDSVDEVAPQLVAHIAEAVPPLTPDEEARALQMASVRGSIRDLAGLLSRAGDPGSATLPEATVALGRLAAHRQLGLTPLIRTYRLGHEVLWQWFTERLAADYPAKLHVPALRLLAGWLFAYVDTVTSLAEQVYEAERDLWMRSALAARVETVEAILAGKERDAQRAGVKLGYDLLRHHVGLVAWSTGGGASDQQRELATSVQQVSGALEAGQRLILPDGSAALFAWISRPTPFTAFDPEALITPPSVRLALGEPGSGLEGFRRTHAEALNARRVATLLGKSAGLVTRYQDVALLSMATADPDQVRPFVARVLGPLASPAEATRRAAETLAVYLDENGSRKAAGARLHIHANTVIYRVRQAEEILGRPLDADTLDLRMALALLPVLGHRPLS